MVSKTFILVDVLRDGKDCAPNVALAAQAPLRLKIGGVPYGQRVARRQNHAQLCKKVGLTEFLG